MSRLPATQRARARLTGVGLALAARIGMLFLLLALSSLTGPIIGHFSTRDMILIAVGLFLLWKALHEIHHTISLKNEHPEESGHLQKSFFIF